MLEDMQSNRKFRNDLVKAGELQSLKDRSNEELDKKKEIDEV